MYYRMEDTLICGLESRLEHLGFRFDGYWRMIPLNNYSSPNWACFWIGVGMSAIPKYGDFSVPLFVWAFMGPLQSFLSKILALKHKSEIADIKEKLYERRKFLFEHYKDFFINESKVLCAAELAIKAKWNKSCKEDEVEFFMDPQSYENIEVDVFCPQEQYKGVLVGQLSVHRDEDKKIASIKITVLLNVFTGETDYDPEEKCFPHFARYNTACYSLIGLEDNSKLEFKLLADLLKKPSEQKQSKKASGF